MNVVTFTHANKLVQIDIVKDLVAGYYKSDAQQCTFVVSHGGAIFPVKETVEETRRKLGATDVTPQPKGEASK